MKKNTISRLRKGDFNMSSEVEVVQRLGLVLFKPVKGQDLHVSVELAAKQATHQERCVIG